MSRARFTREGLDGGELVIERADFGRPAVTVVNAKLDEDRRRIWPGLGMTANEARY